MKKSLSVVHPYSHKANTATKKSMSKLHMRLIISKMTPFMFKSMMTSKRIFSTNRTTRALQNPSAVRPVFLPVPSEKPPRKMIRTYLLLRIRPTTGECSLLEGRSASVWWAATCQVAPERRGEARVRRSKPNSWKR